MKTTAIKEESALKRYFDNTPAGPAVDDAGKTNPRYEQYQAARDEWIALTAEVERLKRELGRGAQIVAEGLLIVENQEKDIDRLRGLVGELYDALDNLAMAQVNLRCEGNMVEKMTIDDVIKYCEDTVAAFGVDTYGNTSQRTSAECYRNMADYLREHRPVLEAGLRGTVRFQKCKDRDRIRQIIINDTRYRKAFHDQALAELAELERKAAWYDQMHSSAPDAAIYYEDDDAIQASKDVTPDQRMNNVEAGGDAGAEAPESTPVIAEPDKLTAPPADWKTELPGGYLGDECPDALKAEVKTWTREHLKERYLDACARVHALLDPGIDLYEAGYEHGKQTTLRKDVKCPYNGGAGGLHFQ